MTDEHNNEDHGYPDDYTVKPIIDQVKEITRLFPDLDPTKALALAENLPEFPQGAEGWFAIPNPNRITPSYNEAVKVVLKMIADSRPFCNHLENKFGPKYLNYLTLTERTGKALRALSKQQKGDIFLFPAQSGLCHRDRSVRQAREVFVQSGFGILEEFGLGPYAAGMMLLLHPKRFQSSSNLHIDCAGARYYVPGATPKEEAPFFSLNKNGEVMISSFWIEYNFDSSGSASGFFPHLGT